MAKYRKMQVNTAHVAKFETFFGFGKLLKRKEKFCVAVA